MIRKACSYLFLVFLGGVAAIVGLSALTAHGAILNAAAVVGDPVATVTAGTDAAWDSVMASGPIIGGAMLLYAILRTFLSKQHWIQQGRLLSGLTACAMVLGAILNWKLGGAASAGIVEALLAAVGLFTHSTIAPPAPAKPPGGGTVIASAVLVLVLGVAANQSACANPGARAEIAGHEAIGCGLPTAVSLALQLRPVFLEALTGAVSGDGLHVDRAKLKAIAAPLLTPALRCAFDSAIAFLLAPTPAQHDAPQAAPFVVDPGAMGSTWLAVRQELAWNVQ
jgi:hypothetical protein